MSTLSYYEYNALNAVARTVVEQEFPGYQMANGSLIDIAAPDGEGVSTYSFDTMTKVGTAAFLANGSEDIPRVNVFMDRHYGNYYDLANSYSYTTNDMAASQRANKPLNTSLAVAAREVIESVFDETCYYGNSTLNLKGLLNYPGVQSITVAADGTGTSTEWSTKTPAQIYRDLRLAAATMKANSKGLYYPTTYIMPQEQFDLISETSYLENSETILSFFLKTQRMSPMGVQNVLPAPRMENGFTGGLNGIVAYTKASDRLEIKMGQEITFSAPQLHNFTYNVPVKMSVGGVAIYKPLSVVQVVGI